MNNEELSGAVSTLLSFGMVQAGKIAAFQTVVDALIATMGTSLPSLASQLELHLTTLSTEYKPELEDEALDVYNENIATWINSIKVLTN